MKIVKISSMLKKTVAIILVSMIFIAIFFGSKVEVLGAGSLADNNTYTAETKDVSIDSSRGTKIQATLMVPKSKTESMALVVMCHGYTGSRKGDGNGFINLGKKLAQNGIAAITIDFPGCGDSSEPSTNYSIANMLSDVNSAVSYMKSNYNIADGELGICGHSMGGRIASYYLPNVKAAALWAPANGEGTNACDFLKRRNFNFEHSPNFENEMESQNPNDNIRSFSGSLLIAYDSEDTSGVSGSDESVISPETVQSVKDAYNASSASKQWKDYTDNHNLDSNKTDLVNLTANLFCNYFVGHNAGEGSSDFGPVEGSTEQELRANFVAEVVKFVRENGRPGKNICIYPDNVARERAITYENGTYSDGTYHFDCVGWVGYAIHYFLGLGADTYTEFVTPTGIVDTAHYTRQDLGTEMPGDILVVDPSDQHGENHVAIYIGNGQVADMFINPYRLEIRDIPNHLAWSGVHYTYVAHLSSFDGIEFNPVPENDDEWLGWFTDFKPQGEIDNTDDNPIDLDELEFEFQGNPAKVDFTPEKTISIQWLFSKISQFVDYIVGIMVSSLKAAIVGWTSIIEGWINSAFKLLSGENNEKIYTIEDVVYNRIPILDVNVFSDVAGGASVQEGTVTYAIRTVVATWYVSFRNVIAVVLFILLIYSGIRMAIATVASDKAKYKTFLVGWLKSIIILFTIHYIIAIILNINGSLVNLFSKGMSSEQQMYETIRTRAYDLRFTVGITGTIMYIIIVIMFVKFAWMYIKRLFTTLILIILAPFVAGKYAYDSASGRTSRVFSSWLYQFTSNVIIQAAHALLYTSLVGIALDIALESITSFIIALVFLNFMLSADKIVLKLFKFTDNIDDMHKPFKKEEQLTGLLYAYSAFNLSKNLAGKGIRATKNFTSGAVDRLSELTGEDYKGEFKGKVDKKLTDIDTFLLDKVDSENLDEKPEKIRQIFTKPVRRYLRDTFILRIASRRKGKSGREARQTLKLRKAKRKEAFSSNYKFILGEVQGVGSVILAVPVMVFNPTVGVGLFATGTNALKKNRKQEKLRDWTTPQKVANKVSFGAYGNRLEAYEKNQRTSKEINDLVKAVSKTHKTITSINTELGKIKDPDKRLRAKEAMKRVNKMRNESSNIRRYMQSYMKENSISTLDEMDDDQKRKMVIDISNKTGAKDVMSREEVDKVGMFVVDTITGKKGNNKFTDLNIDNFSTLISETLTKSSMKSEFLELGLELNKLKDNDKDTINAAYIATEEDDNETLDIDRFIDNL